jgi:mono/diheme cytochrome c family protein
VYPNIPDFTDASWHTSRTDTELSRSILQGKGKSMPRMKEKLGSVDVKQIIAFVRAFREGKQVVNDEPDAADAPEQPPGDTTRSAGRLRSVELPSTIPIKGHDREASRLFQRFCAMCHGPDGTGMGSREHLPMLPDFTRPAWHEGRSDHRLVVSVLDGKGTRMPSFAGKLGREQVRDLVAYIRRFAPSSAQPARTGADDFEARFQQLTDEFKDLGRQIRALSSSTP